MASHETVVEIRSTADFARYVGLARTTVSRVLNGHPGVKRKTIERVNRALEETGFTPNAFAVNLRGKGTSTVGICMENLLAPPMVAKLAALQKRMRVRGITSLIEVLEPGESRRVVQHFQAMQASAVVFIGQFVTEELEQRISELRRRGIAHLVIDQAGVAEANTVTVDRVAAMRQVTNHLIDLGHRSFGLMGMNRPSETIRDRLRGISEALSDRGLDLENNTASLDYLELRKNDFTFGRNLARAFFRHANPPTAYIAVNDEVAIGAMLALQDLGLEVPQDASIVGFKNQDICLITAPTMSSVDQQIEPTIDAAAAMLLTPLDQPMNGFAVHMIDPVFVARESTGPAPVR